MNIVFLDIDGVLQPYDSENRFYEINKKSKELVSELSKKYNIDYSKYSIYDILATYYDWNSNAIERLKYILTSTSSKIIVSSDWRNSNYPFKMRDLLTIHGLGDYWFSDNIKKETMASLDEIRAMEINDSLLKYNINNFAILDDLKGLEEYFPNNTVITNNYISVNDMNKCIKILRK